MDKTGTTSVNGRINYLCTMLQWEVLQEFDYMASQNNGTQNDHFRDIWQSLLQYYLTPPPPKYGVKTEAQNVPHNSETLRGDCQAILCKAHQYQQLSEFVS